MVDKNFRSPSQSMKNKILRFLAQKSSVEIGDPDPFPDFFRLIFKAKIPLRRRGRVENWDLIKIQNDNFPGHPKQFLVQMFKPHVNFSVKIKKSIFRPFLVIFPAELPLSEKIWGGSGVPQNIEFL